LYKLNGTVGFLNLIITIVPAHEYSAKLSNFSPIDAECKNPALFDMI